MTAVEVRDDQLSHCLNKMLSHLILFLMQIFLEKQGKGRYVRDNQWEYLLYSQHHGGFLRKIKE